MKSIALAAVVAALLAAGASAAVTVLHSASGSGHVLFGNTQESISFNAVQHEDGTATGHAQINDVTAGVRFQVDVDCLNVIGNTATISGIITRSSDATIEGWEAIFQVVDNGEGSDPPDLMSIANIHERGTGVDCSVVAEYDLTPLQGGNVQVR
jgi:hypothetical protein